MDVHRVLLTLVFALGGCDPVGLRAKADDADRYVHVGDRVIDVDGWGVRDDHGTLTGGVTYLTTDLGAPECDATIALTGTAYTGGCRDCDWAYYVDGILTEDSSTDACQFFPPLGFIEQGRYLDMIMTYWSTYSGPDGAWDQLFRNGFFYYYPFTHSHFNYDGWFEYWDVSYAGSPYGTFTSDGPYDFSWTFDDTYPRFETNYRELCGVLHDSHATTDFDGQSATGSLSCGQDVLDVWTFEAEAGDDVTVAVDTLDAGTTFAPGFWLNDPSGCMVRRAEDNFACTYPPEYGRCPSTVVKDAQPGTWEVVVYPSDCVGPVGEYVIKVGRL